MTSPKDKTGRVVKLPTQPMGKELRDSFEKVRDEPIPDKLKKLIAELKRKEKKRQSDPGKEEK